MMKNTNNKKKPRPHQRLRYLHAIVENYRRIRAAYPPLHLAHRRGKCTSAA